MFSIQLRSMLPGKPWEHCLFQPFRQQLAEEEFNIHVQNPILTLPQKGDFCVILLVHDAVYAFSYSLVFSIYSVKNLKSNGLFAIRQIKLFVDLLEKILTLVCQQKKYNHKLNYFF